jgi:hypothetical protein
MIDAAAAEIGVLGRQATLALHYQIGAVIASTLLGGASDDEAGQAKLGTSLRILATKLSENGFPTTHTTLSRALAMYRLLLPLGGVATWQHVGPSHLRVLIPLPEPQRTEMLREAERQRLSVKDLEARTPRVIEAHPGASKAKPGRPRTAPIALAVARAERTLITEGGLKDLDGLKRMSPQQLEEVGAAVLRLREQLEALHRRLMPLIAARRS